jgi:hypothetical protein
MNRHISRIDLRLPDRWCGWRPGDGPRVARRAAAELAGTPVAATRLRAALEAVDRAVVGHHSRHVRAGAWVPEPTGDVVAGLACELLAEAPDGPDAAVSYLGRVQRKIYRARRLPARTVYHSADLREVPAGHAVVTLRSHGSTRHEVAWTVFPPGAIEAVELRFDTRSLQRYPGLVEQAEAIARDLRVTLTAPASAGATVPRRPTTAAVPTTRPAPAAPPLTAGPRAPDAVP